MPLYTFECTGCGRDVDQFFNVNEVPEFMQCTRCGSLAKRVISFRGGLQTETAPWLDQSVRDALQNETEKPIETRSEYKKYLKDKNIVERG